MTGATVRAAVIRRTAICNALPPSSFPRLRPAQNRRRWTVDQDRIRIEVRPDIRGGWSVTRDRIVDGCFRRLDAANDYASACARRARRAGLTVQLDVVERPRRRGAG